PMKEECLLTGLLEPTNEPYAIAKVAGIKMCESYNRQYGTCFMAVMPTNLYGPNDDFDLQNSHVLPALIRKFHLSKLAAQGDWKKIRRDEARFGPIPADIKKSIGLTATSPLSSQPSSSPETTQSSELSPQTSVTLWGTGSPKREFLHVDDMVDACIFVMNLDETIAAREFFSYPKPCFVNVGCGEDRTIQDLAVIVKEIVGFKGDYIFDASKPDGSPKKLLDVSRLKELGWQSSIGLHQGIKQTYDWYLDRL
ncbi:NAD-dependent epimerase/dehydratase family protein, partial [Thermodesulfobacteriota bacterium]